MVLLSPQGCVIITMYGSSVVYLELTASLIFNLTGSLNICLWMVIGAAMVAPLTLFKTPKDFW